ncbi:hypothetical protein VTN31DRAFT_4582 [Thermomyces dupontii]|uniref:uncharacterized protein n=1 Tax=Talaromyces thermophilus TaxID=28565 RepID=UPI003741F238
MDFASLKEQVSNLTLYDIKAGVRKVQNAVMNYTEMEAKVREATNNEPWGASSTLMQEIANGTHNYQQLNEIMTMIYRRFTEKSAEEWRQIYKALQLLEFLIKNGSERVVDDARAHMSLLRMLRQFHYIDQNGKDQGINVRNRSQELVKLLSDVDLIRAERKKARANRNKFGGMEGGLVMGGFSGGSGVGRTGRYGGFGSDSFGSYSGGVYGDGGGFGGGGPSEFRDVPRRINRFEEYDEGDAEAPTSPQRSGPKRETKPAPPPKPAEADLVDFGEEEQVTVPTTTTSSTAAGKQPVTGNGLDVLSQDDDEFDDFQSATPAPTSAATIPPPTTTTTTSSTTQFAAPQPVSGTQGASLTGLAALSSLTPTPTSSTTASTPALTGLSSPTQSQAQPQPKQQPPKATGFQPATPNYYTSITTTQPSTIAPSTTGASTASSRTSSIATTTTTTKPTSPAAKSSSATDAFGSLWSTASASAGIQKKDANSNKGPNLESMAKQKFSEGIWGAASLASASSTPAASTTTTGSAKPAATTAGAGAGKGSALDDLLG